MTVTLKAGANSLELGVVRGLPFTHVGRIAEVDLPGARGSGRQDLGKEPMRITLSGALTGDDRYENFDQLERYRGLGYGLKLKSPYLNTVAFLDSVNLAGIRKTVLDYSLRLTESKFKSLDTCDTKDQWHSDDGGDQTIENADPLPKEGEYCFKHTETADQFWIYDDFDIVDLSNYDYVAFWFYVNRIDMTSLELRLYNDENNTWLSYDFLPLITEANKWYRILLHKSEFTVHYGGEPPEEVPFDWSALEEFFFEFTRAGSQEMVFCFDDLGAYE